MAPRTRTIKNKHAANKSGVKNSRAAKSGGSGGGGSGGDSFVVKSKHASKSKIPAATFDNRAKMLEVLKKRRKAKAYTDKELGIPTLNTITPAGVQKPKGKKKGKVFVDDKESMTTILAMVQAEKDGQIESKIMKARQMEEIRQARLAEAEKKDAERSAKFEETKASLRKKRKRNTAKGGDEGDRDGDVHALASTGTKAAKPKKKRVSFAPGTD